MTYSQILSRLNLAYNFFADTVGVDYLEGFSAAEVRELDSDMMQDVWVFPELKRMGY